MDINGALRVLLQWNIKTFRVLNLYLDNIPGNDAHILAQFCNAGRIQNERVYDTISKLQFEPAEGEDDIEFDEDKPIDPQEGVKKEVEWLEKNYGNDFREQNWYFKTFRKKEDRLRTEGGETGNIDSTGE